MRGYRSSEGVCVRESAAVEEGCQKATGSRREEHAGEE